MDDITEDEMSESDIPAPTGITNIELQKLFQEEILILTDENRDLLIRRVQEKVRRKRSENDPQLS